MKKYPISSDSCPQRWTEITEGRSLSSPTDCISWSLLYNTPSTRGHVVYYEKLIERNSFFHKSNSCRRCLWVQIATFIIKHFPNNIYDKPHCLGSNRKVWVWALKIKQPFKRKKKKTLQEDEEISSDRSFSCRDWLKWHVKYDKV